MKSLCLPLAGNTSSSTKSGLLHTNCSIQFTNCWWSTRCPRRKKLHLTSYFLELLLIFPEFCISRESTPSLMPTIVAFEGTEASCWITDVLSPVIHLSYLTQQLFLPAKEFTLLPKKLPESYNSPKVCKRHSSSLTINKIIHLRKQKLPLWNSFVLVWGKNASVSTLAP